MSDKQKKIKRQLPVELTDDEKVKKGHKAGQLKKKIQAIKAEMKIAVADHKETLKETQANLDTILDDLERGTEERMVECEERKDYKRNRATVIRLDTEEVIEERTMSAEEFQETLPAVEGDAGTAEVIPISDTPKRGRGRPKKGTQGA